MTNILQGKGINQSSNANEPYRRKSINNNDEEEETNIDDENYFAEESGLANDTEVRNYLLTKFRR